ncbi:MAG TPA: radical SAM protein [Polyangiaceae bacterium]|nr:radical SAM protein [Polyangiaceae bacterium]
MDNESTRTGVISEDARAALMRAPRPKRDLPIAPHAEPFRKRLPLADGARDIDRRTRPIYAVWEITLKCDLACRHCGSRAGQARPDELSTAEALDLVRQMAELGVKEVTVIGGEAYLREDWTDIIREVRKFGMQSTMTTGGRGMTPERARAAAAAGLMSASVSVDGNRETHDRLRGVQGSYDSAMAALANLAAAGIPVSVNTQINRLSVPDLPHVLETIIAAGGHSWQIQLTVAMGRGADEPAVLLEPYDLETVFPLLVRLKQRCDEGGVRLWPGNNIGYFGPYESILRGQLPLGHMASCGAGRATLGIEADGTIKGCPSLTTHGWAGGNVRENSLQDIWERAKPLRYTRDRTVDDLWGFCRTCYYADECRAGCTWTSDVLFGKPGNNPFCHHRVLELAKEGKRERLIQVQQAPGAPFDNGKFEIVLEDRPAT